MDISSKISKVKNYRKISDSEYQLQAAWTSSDMVEMNNGNSLEKELENLNTDIDNKLSALETNIDWKETVETYDDIATIYPNPEDGWTVNTKDNNITYRYNGSEWVAISANAIPKATDSVDGLLSKEDHAKYDGSALKAHTHDNKSVLDVITGEKVSDWDNKSDFSGSYNDLSDKPTIPKADGTTITADEDGTLHGATTVECDTELSDTSENPVQNKVIKAQIDSLNQAIEEAKALKASLEQYGMVQLNDTSVVTDSTGLALPATEKNPNLEGTLANQISQLNTDLESLYSIKMYTRGYWANTCEGLSIHYYEGADTSEYLLPYPLQVLE